MNLHEYQAKYLFARYGIPVPTGYVCTSPSEAEEVARKIGSGPWVVKCQVHAGGRGKAGGVKVVNSIESLRDFVEYWVGKSLVTYQTDSFGQPVSQILVEEKTDTDKELYLGAVIDRSSRRVVFMASTEGGIDIEEVSKSSPELIYKVIIDPVVGPQLYQGRQLAFQLGLIGKQVNQFAKIFMGLAILFMECDLAMAEINPLVITKNGKLLCLDGKLSADGNALFRQPKLREMRDISQEDGREFHAAQWELNYVALDGNIGCMVNGAGLAMGTMDIFKLYGGEPANFLDVGGGATKERITEAFKIILSDKKVKTVLVNIFGGIVRCDLIADGIIAAIGEVGINIPVVVRLDGNNAELGTKKLSDSGLNIIAAVSLTDAARQVVSAAEGKNVYFN